MADNFSWSDAHSEMFGSDGYVPVPFPLRTVEPMDDYNFETFSIWLDRYTSYLAIIREMQYRNGVR